MHDEVSEAQEIELLCDEFWGKIRNSNRDRKFICVLGKAAIIKCYRRLNFDATCSCIKLTLLYVEVSVKLLFISLSSKTSATE
jgi:hypothetical protein